MHTYIVYRQAILPGSSMDAEDNAMATVHSSAGESRFTIAQF
ncbi:MAG: hypothetical protein ACTHLE_23155 [Agriterribacter sp.]